MAHNMSMYHLNGYGAHANAAKICSICLLSFLKAGTRENNFVVKIQDSVQYCSRLGALRWCALGLGALTWGHWAGGTGKMCNGWGHWDGCAENVGQPSWVHRIHRCCCSSYPAKLTWFKYLNCNKAITNRYFSNPFSCSTKSSRKKHFYKSFKLFKKIHLKKVVFKIVCFQK